jgi:hypothetical protein
MRKNLLYLLFATVICKSYSQDFVPLFNRDYIEQSPNTIVETEEGDYIFTNRKIVTAAFSNTNHLEVGGSFTTFYKFDKFGSILSIINLPDSNNYYHDASAPIQLNDGRWVVAGNIKQEFGTYDFFFAIINSQFDSIEFYHKHDTFGQRVFFREFFVNSENHVVIFGGYQGIDYIGNMYLFKFDLAGEFLGSYMYDQYHEGSGIDFVQNYNLIWGDSVFFSILPKSSGLVINKYIKNGLSYSESTTFNESGNLFGIEGRIFTGEFGVAYGDTSWLVASVVDVDSAKYPSIIKINSNSVEPFFIDTSESHSLFHFFNSVRNNHYFYLNYGGYAHLNRNTSGEIYSAFVDTALGGLIVYKLNEDGVEIWKRELVPDVSLKFIPALFSLKATSDGGCLLLIGIERSAFHQDVYMIKLNAQGEVVAAFETPSSIFKVNNNPFTLYPNPARNTVNFVAENQQDFEVQLYDLQGRKVLSKKAFNTSALEVNVEALASGVYYYQLLNPKGEAMQQGKVIRE